MDRDEINHGGTVGRRMSLWLAASVLAVGVGVTCSIPMAQGNSCPRPTWSLTRLTVECLDEDAACEVSAFPWDALTSARWWNDTTTEGERVLWLHGTADSGGEEVELTLYLVEE